MHEFLDGGPASSPTTRHAPSARFSCLNVCESSPRQRQQFRSASGFSIAGAALRVFVAVGDCLWQAGVERCKVFSLGLCSAAAVVPGVLGWQFACVG